MSSTPLPEAHTGTKRKRELIFELPSELDNGSGCSSLTDPQGHDADIEGESGQVCNDDKEQRFLHLIWGYQSEESEPAGKRRPENVGLEHVTDIQKHSSKGVMGGFTTAEGPEEIPESRLHRDQTPMYSHENIQIHTGVCGENKAFSASLTTEDPEHQSVPDKRALLSPCSATEVQNTMKCKIVKSCKEPELFEQRPQWSPVKQEDKENRHSNTLSPFKLNMSSSPAKRSSDFNRKLCRMPRKSIREAQENDEDSFSTLFTQDSEGFRVIAHHSKRARYPLQDQTNSREARECLNISSVRLLETEISDPGLEVLFTQDSQGNVVIKH